MSFRTQTQVLTLQNGSIFGNVLNLPLTQPQVDRLRRTGKKAADETAWPEAMAVSPVLEATGPEEGDVPALSIGEPSVLFRDAPKPESKDEGRSKRTESVVHTWAHSPAEWHDSCYTYFERQSEPAVMCGGAAGARWNDDPVLPRMVNADMLVWMPMTGADGSDAHAFRLLEKQVPVATIEVYALPHSPRKPCRIQIVHASYSALGRESGMCDQGSMLVYSDPERHLEQLRELKESIEKDEDVLYAPVAEAVAGKGLERLPLRHSTRAHRSSAHALPLWTEVKAFLGAMRTEVQAAVDRHNRREFERCGLQDALGACSRAWSVF